MDIDLTKIKETLGDSLEVYEIELVNHKNPDYQDLILFNKNGKDIGGIIVHDIINLGFTINFIHIDRETAEQYISFR